jgi:hypothetical protein
VSWIAGFHYGSGRVLLRALSDYNGDGWSSGHVFNTQDWYSIIKKLGDKD